LSTQRLPSWTTDVPRNPVQATEEEEEEVLSASCFPLVLEVVIFTILSPLIQHVG
jgi:hypothetical protein